MPSRDERYMLRVLDLARQGHGTTWPNPMVGSVVVQDDRVLGEGFHRQAGGPHGEVDALARCAEATAGATLYVNLEPCSHHNRTGPCSDAIIAAGIGRVVVGTCDTNPKVAGTGIAALKRAGIDVTCGVLERECTELNVAYFTSRAQGRPHITLKSATDLFGRTSTRTGESKWITGETARRHAHGVRATAQAIAVGSGTALADNPRLTARRGGRSPIRVVFDSRLRVPLDAALYAEDGVPVIVYTTEAGLRSPSVGVPDHRADVVACGDDSHVDLASAMENLAAREVVDLLVEGGATFAGALVDAGLFDRVTLYLAPRVIGGDEAPGPLRGRGVDALASTPWLEFLPTERLGSNLLVTARRPLEIPCSQD